MLVLSRKVGQQIVVPGLDLVVTVVSIEGTKVRLGVSAPPEIAVHREEIHRRIRERARTAPQTGRSSATP